MREAKLRSMQEQVTKLKIVGIAGSPRKGGNTDLLFEQVMSGAQDAGGEINNIYLRDLHINPCRHCDGCLKNGTCVVNDDMQPILKYLRSADRLVLASPIFFMSISAQMKAMIDRCQSLWAMKFVLKQSIPTNLGGERKGLFVAVGGTSYPNLFQPSFVIIKSLFSVIDVKLVGDLTFRGIDEKGEIIQHPTALNDAYLLGKSLANNSIMAGSNDA